MSEAGFIDHDLAVSRRGLAVAWHGAYGPAVAVLPSPSAIAPAGGTHLPGRAPGRSSPPALLPWRRGFAVAWAADEGSRLGFLDAQGGLAGPPLVVHPGARVVGLGASEHLIAVASADADGIVVTWIGTEDVSRVVGGRRVVEASDVGPCLRLVPGEEGVIVLYSTAGGRRLGVVYVDRHAEHAPRDVRHPLPAPVESIHATSVRGLRAVALCYGSEGATRVDLAVLDPRGVTRERPHAVLTERGGRLAHAHPLWIETGLALAAVDESARRLHLVPVSEGVDVGARLHTVPGAARMAWWQRRLLVTRLEADGERVELAVRRVDRQGEADATSRVDVTPPDTARLGRRLRGRELVDAVRSEIGGRAYRDAGTVAHASPDGLSLSLDGAAGPATIRFDPRPNPPRLELVACAKGGELPERIAPPSSLVRLARWVRARLSREAAEALEDERRWAELTFDRAVAIDRVDGAGPWMAVVLTVWDLPGPQTIHRWLEAMHERLRQTSGRRKVADSSGIA